MQRNLAALRKPDDHSPPLPEPTLEEVAKCYGATPVEAEREVRELVGKCLWDIFSDNHEVYAADGRRLDFGSFRASGGFLADLLNRATHEERYDYLDFYMGTVWIAQRADLGPVYCMIFRRLHCRQLDWAYQFPRLYAIDFAPLKEALEQKDEPDWLNYSPSEALAKEEEKKEHELQVAELRESLDEGYREAVEEALKGPPPLAVQSYQAIYGHDPRGWPPSL